MGIMANSKREEESRERIAAAATQLQQEYAPSFPEFILIHMCFLFIAFTFPITIFCCLKMVQPHEKAVIFRFGRLLPGGPQGPGIIFIIPCTDTLFKVDISIKSLDVPPQVILTRDSVPITVEAVVNNETKDPTVSLINDGDCSTCTCAEQTLRDVLGTNSMSFIWKEQADVNATMQKVLNEAANAWGIVVESVEIKNLILPDELQRALDAESKTAREAKAKINTSEGIVFYTPPCLT